MKCQTLINSIFRLKCVIHFLTLHVLKFSINKDQMDFFMKNLQAIYVNKINEAMARLLACERFLAAFAESNDVLILESAVLQMRKSL